MTALIVVGIFSSCDNSELPNPVGDVIKYYKGTQSPGDVWEWEINETTGKMTASWDYGTFDNTDDDISIEGDVEKLSSGYLKVTITNVTPASEEIPTNGTAWFYAMELPNMALVIKPEGAIKGDIIAMVAQGDATQMAGDYNYIITAPGNGVEFDPNTEESLGAVTMTPSVDGFDISGNAWSLDCYTGACSYESEIGGVPTAVVEENGNFKIYDTEDQSTVASGQYTEAGILMVDFGYGNGGVFALRQNDLTMDVFNGNQFNGIAYFPTRSGNDKTVPVALEIGENGMATGFAYSNIETNQFENESVVSIEFLGIDKGMVNGLIHHNDGTDTVLAGAVLSQGEKQILILSSTTSEEGNPPFVLIMTSK